MTLERLLSEANRLRDQARLPEALACLEQAAALDPNDPGTALTLGVTLLDLQRPREAVAPLERLVALVPQFAEARNILASALLSTGQSSAALLHVSAALQLRPGHPATLENLGRCLRALGRMDEALPAYDAAAASSPQPATHSNAVFAAQYVAGLGLAELTARASAWARRHTAPWATRPRPPRASGSFPAPGARLRIGYVSADFRQHAVAFFLEPVLCAHDPAAVETFCYVGNREADPVTARLRAAAHHWRDITRMDDEAAAACIRADHIDVLVDLSGHTADHRLGVFARRPAPCQLTWLGYPATTGLTVIDFRVTDDACIPPGVDERLHGAERLLRLPEVFCCYRPPADAPEVGPLPCLDGAPFTFISCNALAKLSSATIAVWAAVLNAVPDSRLRLHAPGGEDASAQTGFVEKFAAHGIASGRVVLSGEPLPVRSHLARYHAADLALDSTPYAGTTTTCEALLMGVPVITLAGETHVSRVGVSLLRAVGLTECVGQTTEEFVRIAVRFAQDHNALATLRAGLRARLLSGPLGQTTAFTRNWETALRTAHDEVATAAS
jgi:predicted O-linked N-acetylglucosamine transferase (SPINDLY family)